MSDTYATSVFRRQDTGQFVIKDASRVELTADSPLSLSTLGTKFDEIIALLDDAGINPPSGGNDGEEAYLTGVYREPGDGKVRVKGATQIAAFDEVPSDFATFAAAVNSVLALLTDAGINLASGESLLAETSHSTDVYQEQDTGKVRVKGMDHIADLAESPESLGDAADKLDEILERLEDIGLNPAS